MTATSITGTALGIIGEEIDNAVASDKPANDVNNPCLLRPLLLPTLVPMKLEKKKLRMKRLGK